MPDITINTPAPIVVQVKGGKTTAISSPTGSATRLVELSDVNTANLADGEVLTYIAANTAFEFAPQASASATDQTARNIANAAFDKANTANVTGQAAFDKANTAIYTAAQIRANLSNTTPVNYDSSTGVISHADSSVTPTTYGNTTYVPTITVDTKGHVTSITNTAIALPPSTDEFARAQANASFDKANAANVLANTANTVAASAYGQANAAFDKANTAIYTAAQIRANISNTAPINYAPATGTISHADSGVTPTTYGNTTFVPTITVDAQGHVITISNTVIALPPSTDEFARAQANAAFDKANAANVLANTANTVAESAYANANTAIYTASQIRANISNSSPIAYNSTTGVVSIIPPTANGQLLISNTVSSGYDVNTLTQGSGIVITNDKGSITIAATGGSTEDQFARDQANAAYSRANTANTVAASAYNQANIATTNADAAFTRANLANDVAASAYANANTAIYTAAQIRANISNTTPILYDSATGVVSLTTVPVTKGGTGQTAITVNGSLLLGNTVSGGFDVNPITQGTNITVTNDKGSITIASSDAFAQAQANAAFNKANDAYANANTAIYTAAQIRANISNNAPINYNLATGVISHAVSGVTASGYGDATTVPKVVVDDKGHVTSVANTAIQLGSTSQVGLILLEDSVVSQSVANAATANAVNSTHTLANTAEAIAQAAYNFANTVEVLAQGAYDKANAANTLAQTARDKANTSNVLSVASRGGDVVLNTNDVSENAAGPYYFTATRVRANISNTAPINYNSTTGIISHAVSGVMATGYGDSGTIPTFAVDDKGHVTSVTNTAIAISAAAITSGTLAVARGGTGQTAITVNGSLLIGNTVSGGFDVNTITQGSGIQITNDKGSITIASTGGTGADDYARSAVNNEMAFIYTDVAANGMYTSWPSLHAAYVAAGSPVTKIGFYVSNTSAAGTTVTIPSGVWDFRLGTSWEGLPDAYAQGCTVLFNNGARISGVGVFSDLALRSDSSTPAMYLDTFDDPITGLDKLVRTPSLKRASVLSLNTAAFFFSNTAETGFRLYENSTLSTKSLNTASNVVSVVLHILGGGCSVQSDAFVSTNAASVLSITRYDGYSLFDADQSTWAGVLKYFDNDAIIGSTAARPTPAENGSSFYDQTLDSPLWHVAGTWRALRGYFSNTAPINYSSSTGAFSHADSGVVATGYGNAATVPVFVVNATGHLTVVTNTAIAISTTQITSGTLVAARGGTGQTAITVNGAILIANTVSSGYDLNTLTAGSGIAINTDKGSIEIVATGAAATDQFARDTANGAYLKANGAAQNVFVTINVAGQNNVIADSNSDTLILVAGTYTSITTDDTNDTITIGSTGDQFARDQANAAYANASAAFNKANGAIYTAAQIRANLSNTAPVNYDSSTGVISHADSGATPTTYGNTTFVPTITVDAQGHVTSIVNTAINFPPGGVTSVSGKTGAVLLDTYDISENLSSNLWFTAARVRANISNTAPINYAPATGVISHADSGVVATGHGDVATVPKFIVDARGHVTSVTNTAIAISATQITSGTLAVARGGTGQTAITVNGSLLIGNTVSGGFDVNPITSTSPISIANDKGSIILSHDTSGVVATGHGDAATVPKFVVDDKGHVTSVVNTTIAITTSQVSESAGGPFFHTAARVRGNVANTAPINYDASTGVFSHADSGVVATGHGDAATVPTFIVNATGHVTSVSNTAIAISATQITSGTLVVARGGTGQTAITVNGSLLVGNTVSGGFDVNALTQGSGIQITNDKGSITIAATGGGSMPTGNGGDTIFYENSQNVTANYTITSGKSAMSTGPVTINSGVIVTIPSGSRWVIL